jgi:protein CpxP
MNSSIRNVAAPAVLALACFTTSAWAQTAAPADASSAAATTSAASRAQKHADFVEKRISDLHAQMKITSQQAPQWDAFAQTMRDNAQKTDAAFKDRAQKLPSENADDSMKSYAALAQLHADNMQKLAAAFSALYATLSDDQKKIADPLFRNQHAQRHAAPHKHKRAAPAGSASAPAPASN